MLHFEHNCCICVCHSFPAEFIIALSEKHDTFDAFKTVLLKNGAEFSDSFTENLLRLIQHMQPKDKLKIVKTEKDVLAEKFPALSMPNEPKVQAYFDENQLTSKKQKKTKKERNVETVENCDIIDKAMAELEALAPSNVSKKAEEDKEDCKIYSRERENIENSEKGREDHIEKKRTMDRSSGKGYGREKRSRSVSRSRNKRKAESRSGSRSRDKRKARSRSGSRSRRRGRSTSSSRERKRGRRRTRSRSNNIGTTRSGKCRSYSTDKSIRRQRSGSRNDDRYRRDRRRKERSKSPEHDLPCDPEVGKIYNGKVANIVPFGCFVQLENLRKRWEGLVHISQLRREGRVTMVSDVVSRGQKVKVS